MSAKYSKQIKEDRKCSKCGSVKLTFRSSTGESCKEGEEPVYINRYNCNNCLHDFTLKEYSIGLPIPEGVSDGGEDNKIEEGNEKEAGKD